MSNNNFPSWNHDENTPMFTDPNSDNRGREWYYQSAAAPAQSWEEQLEQMDSNHQANLHSMGYQNDPIDQFLNIPDDTAPFHPSMASVPTAVPHQMHGPYAMLQQDSTPLQQGVNQQGVLQPTMTTMPQQPTAPQQEESPNHPSASLPLKRATELFKESFPLGWEVIPNEGATDDLCGLHAIRDSWVSKRAEEGDACRLPAWRNEYVDEIRKYLVHGRWQQRFQRACPGEPLVVDNFFHEQLVDGLSEFGQNSLGLNLRLGRFQSQNRRSEGQYSVLCLGDVPDDESMIILWIHHNGVGGLTGDHWEGLGPGKRKHHRAKNMAQPEAGNTQQKPTTHRMIQTMSKEEAEVHRLREAKLKNEGFPDRYRDLGRFRRDCEVSESLHNANADRCTFPDKRGKKEADDTFPRSDAELIQYAEQLYEAIIDCDDFRDWSDAMKLGKRQGSRREDLDIIGRWINSQYPQVAPSKEFIPEKALEWMPSADKCIKVFAGREARLNNHAIAQVSIELAQACVDAQQGIRKSLRHHHSSGWESYPSYAERVQALGYVLRTYKQMISRLTAPGNSETIRLANFPAGEENRKLLNKRGNDKKSAILRVNNTAITADMYEQAVSRQRGRRMRRAQSGLDPDGNSSSEDESEGETAPDGENGSQNTGRLSGDGNGEPRPATQQAQKKKLGRPKGSRNKKKDSSAAPKPAAASRKRKAPEQGGRNTKQAKSTNLPDTEQVLVTDPVLSLAQATAEIANAPVGSAAPIGRATRSQSHNNSQTG